MRYPHFPTEVECTKPLNQEQIQLAANNHQMVYAFLNEKALPEEDFYDVVVFGYLCGIQDYCEKKSLKHYKLSTITWRRMNRELHSHYREQDARKRRHEAVSLQEPIAEPDGKCWQDILPDNCDALSLLQVELLLHSLALSPRERRIIHKKIKGCDMHDIAKTEKMTFKAINDLLTALQPAVLEALQE